MFDPLEPLSTAESLDWCVQNRERLKEMGKESQRIERGFSPCNAAEAIMKACEIAISSSRRMLSLS